MHPFTNRRFVSSPLSQSIFSRFAEADTSASLINISTTQLYAGTQGSGGGQSTQKDAKPEEAGSITDPDSELTGDTGNLTIGQTDLGASGVGAGTELTPEGIPKDTPLDDQPAPEAATSQQPTGEIADPEAGVGHS